MEYFILLYAFAALMHLSEGIKCYHCYDSFQKEINSCTVYSSPAFRSTFHSTFVRCDKNPNKWNSWECPKNKPVCVIVSATVKDHKEVIRTCAEKDFCSKYKPPAEVKLQDCQECNSTLCNDFFKIPEPPVKPPFHFNINMNVNVNIRKYPCQKLT